jgi:DNA polymerase III alpha subunit (gram-positive type)|tara:strand:+ start:143 stop:757 length:615 start_codon:yes stop_codon:yes gene_type:complete
MATVIYDFETSGLNVYKEDVIEIGAKCVETDKVYNSLVIPMILAKAKQGIPSKITEITGITNDLLKKDGKKTLQAFLEFFNFLQDIYEQYNEITLVAHNGLSFDDLFLRRMLRYVQGEGHTEFDEMFENIIYIDSLMLSRYIHPTRRYHSMKDLCGLYNVTNESAHRAMGDVNALVEIWSHLIKHVKQLHADCSGTHLKYILYL